MRPGWLTPRTALAAVLVAVPIVATSLDLSGGWKAVSIGGVVAAACAAVGLDQHDRSKQAAAEAARSRLDVEVTLVPDVVEKTADPEAFIAAWVQTEREACLASLPSGGAPVRPAFRELDEVLGELDDTEDDAAGLTLGEMEGLEARVNAGETLSGEDQARYKAAKRAIKLAGFSAAIAASSSLNKVGQLGNAFSSPDDRTEQQYHAQVEAYLKEGGGMLRAAVRWTEIKFQTARTQVQIVNSTDRNYSSVEVEVYFPGDHVHGVDLDDVPDLPDPESRPRPFGARIPHNYGLDLGSIAMPYFPSSPRMRYGPTVDNSGSVRVTYRPIDLRPGEHLRLDPVHLVTTAPAGTVLRGTWTATATNVDGRATGDLIVTVSESTVDVDGVLTTWLAGDVDPIND